MPSVSPADSPEVPQAGAKTEGRTAGLSSAEAAERLKRFGPNSITQEQVRPPWRILLAQLKSPLVFLLALASGVSFVFQEWLDGFAILIVIVLNAGIGFYMEFQAGRSMDTLRKMSAVLAKVLRDGQLKEIDSVELVPDDVLFLEAGDLVPADARLLNATQLQADESALTGESLPVEKSPGDLPDDAPLAEQTNRIFKGTFITRGNAEAVILATGMNTELGKIARMVQTADQAATPLEKKLQHFSGRLIWLTVGLVVLIFGVGLAGGQGWLDMLTTSIALAVAAIPEGLPIVATLALAQGMLRLARQNVVVRKLSAVETLGGTTIICTDKTGTLTENKLAVEALATPGGRWDAGPDAPKPAETIAPPVLDLIARVAVLCNTAEVRQENGEWKEIGDPLETAMLKFAIQQGIDPAALRRSEPKTGEQPFTSEAKFMATWHSGENGTTLYAKGAAEELLKLCSAIREPDGEKPMTPEVRDTWFKEAEAVSARGLRVIACAFRQGGEQNPSGPVEQLVLAGLLGLIDPPRPTVGPALEMCRQAGIGVIMVTGDHPATARAIGRQLGLLDGDEGVILGRDMKPYEQLDPEEKKRWSAARIFARVSPQQKLDLVQVLQEQGEIAGMTGDGVNDAPALKKADIGIAMGLRGTQVAKEVADMWLRDDSFASIVVAIRQGRIIFDNIRKFAVYLLSCNLSELMVIALVAVLFLQYQLRPLQILFINLVTDVLPALALGVTAGSPEIMQRPPKPPSEPIIDAVRWKRIFFYAAVMSAATVGALYVRLHLLPGGAGLDPVRYNNILFFGLIFCQLLHVFNMGSLEAPFYRTEVARNPYVWYALAASGGLVFLLYQFEPVRAALTMGPMAPVDWAVCAGAGLVSMTLIRWGKHLKFFQTLTH